MKQRLPEKESYTHMYGIVDKMFKRRTIDVWNWFKY